MSDEKTSEPTSSGLMPFTLVTPVTMSTTDSTITTAPSPQPSTVNNKIPDEPKPSAVVSESQPVVVVSEISKAQQQTSTNDRVVNDQVKHKETDKGGQENKVVENLTPKDTTQDADGKQIDVDQGEEATPSSSSTSSLTKDQTSTSEERGALLIRFRKSKKSSDNGDERVEMAFVVKQDESKNDSYCWICHEGGEVLCCDKCPRVLHLRCSNLQQEPEGDEWTCPTCRGIAKKSKKLRPSNLQELLTLAVKRMMFPGTELFQMEVTEAIAPGYRDHVFFPMDLGTIKKNVEAGKYHSTKEFVADTEWIQHNCIIYNGARHVLTKTAKAIVRIAKEDMKEIELCSNCYKLSVQQPTDWFAMPCVPPHRVVLAKVRGYPLWPAKLLSESTDRCDVRFFGQHDRAIISKSGIQELKGHPPVPPNKHIHWNQAIYELTKYRESIKEMRPALSEKELKLFLGEQGTSLPPAIKFPKLSSKLQDGRKDQQERSISPHSSSGGSSYEPFSPQVVPVKVNIDFESEPRGDPSYAPVSSPDSEPELKIDYDYEPGVSEMKKEKKRKYALSPQPHRTDKPPKSSSIKKTSHPTSLGLAMKKQATAVQGSGVHFSKKVATNNSSPQKMVLTPTGFKPNKLVPGSVLSSLASQLAEKAEKKQAEMTNGFQAIPKKNKPIQPAPPKYPVVSFNEEVQSEESLISAFSSLYPREKTAIAVVDPENKRKRKPKQAFVSPEQQPSKRKATHTNSPVKVPSASGKGHHAALVKNTTQDIQSAGLTFDDISAIWGGGMVSEGASPSIIVEPETSSESEPEDDAQANDEGGLLESTIGHVRRAFTTRVKSIRGKSSTDMGYRYYSDKFMVAFQSVLLEMLSDYHGGPETQELKDKLKSSWPLGTGMASALDSLRKELKKEMESQLELVRASAELEREQVVGEVRRQAEVEKSLAVEEATMETKRHVWCRNCWKEAGYSCCWNTNYCSEECQIQHWPEHWPEHDHHFGSNTPQQQQPLSGPPRTPSFDAGNSGAGTFNFAASAAAAAASRMMASRSGSFSSPHPQPASSSAFTFGSAAGFVLPTNVNTGGAVTMTTSVGGVGPPPLTPAPIETAMPRAGPQPIPAEITTPVSYQLMSTGLEQQLYQTPAMSTVAASPANWTLVTTPSMLGSHTAQTHPPVLQRNNPTVFYH